MNAAVLVDSGVLDGPAFPLVFLAVLIKHQEELISQIGWQMGEGSPSIEYQGSRVAFGNEAPNPESRENRLIETIGRLVLENPAIAHPFGAFEKSKLF